MLNDAQLFTRPLIQVVAISTTVCAALYLTWWNLTLTYREPKTWLVAMGVVCCAVLFRKLPWFTSLWWLAGAISLAWSLAPGNTLVISLWEVLYVAAFAAGAWRPSVWLLSVLLLMSGLERSLALNLFGIESYISGSIHYVAGAQALVLVPLAFSKVLITKSPIHKALFALVLILSTYMAMISGARAVYLPLTLVLAVTVIRSSISGPKRWLAPATVVVLAGALVGLDAVMPNNPMAQALGTKGTVSAQVAATSDSGVLTQRLRFWEQALDMAVENPQGTGTGSFQAVTHAYQRYPMLWSSSPHNYFIETAATGGWLRLVLLLVVLVVPVWRAWRSRHWPWALATVGIWTTLVFDITANYPIFMMYAFLVLGATYFVSGSEEREAPTAAPLLARRRSLSLVSGLLYISVATGYFAWWFVPCTVPTCATARYLGVDFKALPALVQVDNPGREALISRLRELYPQSLWVVQVEQAYASRPEDKLRLAREIAERFPFQHPENYLAWANAALAVGDESEARRAITAGLRVFSDGSYPYGEVRMTPERYQAWLEEAERILAEVE